MSLPPSLVQAHGGQRPPPSVPGHRSVTPDNSDRSGRRGVDQGLLRGDTFGQAERDDTSGLEIGVNATKRPVRPNGKRG